VRISRIWLHGVSIHILRSLEMSVYMVFIILSLYRSDRNSRRQCLLLLLFGISIELLVMCNKLGDISRLACRNIVWGTSVHDPNDVSPSRIKGQVEITNSGNLRFTWALPLSPWKRLRSKAACSAMAVWRVFLALNWSWMYE
jgi:hypothetical protein